MVLKQDKHFAEAVFFLKGKEVIKELLYVEFDAVLESVVGIPEFANGEHLAAYVTISSYLTTRSVVLFKIQFDQDGHVEKSWNLPLYALARDAVLGPDLGQGSILVLTRSNCDNEHKNDLWAPGKNEIAILTAIRDAVKRNKLGIYDGGDRRRYGADGLRFGVPDFELEEELLEDGDDYKRDLIANIEKTLKHKYEDQIKKLHQHRDEVVNQLESQIKVLEKQAAGLKKQISTLEKEGKVHVDAIAGKYKKKLDKKLAQLKDSLTRELDTKALELHYSQDSEIQAQEEICQLKESIEGEKRQAVNGFLMNLLDAGVELIVTRSGIGSYSLKPEQVDSYIESTTEFWAKQLGVSETQYSIWYEHYQNPVCQAGNAADCSCGEPLTRVDHPQDFVSGYSDLCQAHQLKQSKDVVQGY